MSVQRHPVQNSSHIKGKIGSKTWLALLSLCEGNAKQRLLFRAPFAAKDIVPIKPKLQPHYSGSVHGERDLFTFIISLKMAVFRSSLYFDPTCYFL